MSCGTTRHCQNRAITTKSSGQSMEQSRMIGEEEHELRGAALTIIAKLVEDRQCDGEHVALLNQLKEIVQDAADSLTACRTVLEVMRGEIDVGSERRDACREDVVGGDPGHSPASENIWRAPQPLD